MKRIWIPLLVGLLSLSGVAVAADAFVVTEREELDGFVDDITAASPEARLDGVLSHANPSQIPCRLTVDGRAEMFGEGEGASFSEGLRTALRVFDSNKQELLQQSVKVDGNQATVTARLGDDAYEQTVIYDLVRVEKRWLVKGLRVL